MCGRFGVKLPFSTLAKLLRAEPVDDDLAFGPLDLPSNEWGPDYNIAPTDRAPVVIRSEGLGDRIGLALFRWGLVPFWASDPKVGARMINARAESVAEKPAFRESFKSRRLLVPVSGWYEWTHPEADPTKKKKDQPRPTPHWISSPRDEVILLAGLGATWSDKASGKGLRTFSIITTEAADSTRAVHDRMPVVLEPSQQDLWLDPTTPPDALSAMLRPYRGALEHYPVDLAVNNVRADGPELIVRIGRVPDSARGQ